MIDLSNSIAPIRTQLSAALAKYAGAGSPAELLFLHVHPNYGQIHIYISPDADADPYDDLGGNPIDDVIDIEGWEDESNSAEPRFTLVDGAAVSPPDNDQFNVLIGQHVNEVTKALVSSCDPALAPNRVIVESESGEFHDEW